MWKGLQTLYPLQEECRIIDLFCLKKYFFSSLRKNFVCKRKRDSTTKDKEEVENLKRNQYNKSGFLEYQITSDLYIKLHELKIITPTVLQKTVIPLLLQSKISLIGNKRNLEKGSVYNEILKNRIQINEYFQHQTGSKNDLYNVQGYKFVQNINQQNESGSNNEIEESKMEEKCFNDVYLIVSPNNSGKTVGYFIPLIHNFYLDYERRMQYASQFYNFLNKYNYKKGRNKLFRKKERGYLADEDHKENLFFDIRYEKFKVRNRYVRMRVYRNYNTNSYILNKKNNRLNSLKHKKNVSFPFAMVLTNTRESACELFSFFKEFSLNVELLAGGYSNKKKKIQKEGVQLLDHSTFDTDRSESLHTYNVNESLIRNEEYSFASNRFFMKRKRMVRKHYNIDLMVGTPDKIFEKVEHYKNKHLYNFKFLKYIIVENADSLCNVFNEQKLQLVLHHISTFTNMYYFYKGDTQKKDPLLLALDKTNTGKIETKEDSKIKKEHEIGNNTQQEEKMLGRKRERKITDEIIESKEKLLYKRNIKKNKENVLNTLRSNIPILIFTSSTKTVCINEFIQNYIRSKHIQQIINLKSHDINDSIKHIFINSKNKEKISLLLEMLGSHRHTVGRVVGKNSSKELLSNRFVIFCNTRRGVENIRSILSELNYSVSSIHSEMKFKERTQNYRDFKKNRTNILVCTNMLSRGIFFENVQYVNYDMSNNINDYIYKASNISPTNTSGIVQTSSLTSFFNKKNSGVINEIIEKSSNKNQIVFQNLNKKVSKLLKLQRAYYDIIKKKQRKKKKGGRKELRVSPRRNCMSTANKILSKKMYFYKKMEAERERLIKKGILKKHQKIPRFPDRRVEEFDSKEYPLMKKLEDGSLQLIAKKRKTKIGKKKEEDGKYEEDTIVLEHMPNYEEESKIKERVHQKKTYF